MELSWNGYVVRKGTSLDVLLGGIGAEAWEKPETKQKKARENN